MTPGLIAFGLIAGLSFATWLVSLRKHDVSIVDGMWPVFIAAAGVVYSVTPLRLEPRGAIALLLLLAWAVRLCLHITVRNHGAPEDRRYQKIRANNQPNFGFKSLYLVFGLQAVLAWIVALPFMATAAGTSGFGVLDACGAALAAFGIAFESVADWQLERFRKRADSRSRVLDTGLWRYSRHPNYFGECCVWWGFGLLALGAGGWWGLVSPLLMTVLLLRVSGVTLLESDMAERRPGYARYVSATNAFVPGRPGRLSAPGGAHE